MASAALAIQAQAERFQRGDVGKPSQRWVATNLDLQCWLTLWTMRLPAEHTPNDVIRRIAGLGRRQR